MGNSSPSITSCAKRTSSARRRRWSSPSFAPRYARSRARNAPPRSISRPNPAARTAARRWRLIDPEGVTKALRELSAGAAVPAAIDPEAMKTRLSNAQIDAIFDLARTRESKGNDDLVAIGAMAIGALIAGLIASR